MTSPSSGPQAEIVRCAGCDAVLTPWTTKCLRCGTPVPVSAGATPPTTPLARPIAPSDFWIDVPISPDEPVKIALLTAFLADQGMEFEQSRRFISIPSKYAEDLVERINLWGIKNGLLNDERHADSLRNAQREIATAVMSAIVADYPSVPPLQGLAGIDLR